MTKELPWWILADFLVPAALLALWAPPLLAIFQMTKGNMFLGSCILVVWCPLFVWVVRACHRRQVIRIWLSVGSTVLVLLILGVMILSKA